MHAASRNLFRTSELTNPSFRATASRWGRPPAHARAPPLQDMTPPARLSRMEAKYESEGLRRTVEGVLLIHQHDHPHVLLLQFGPNAFRLCVPHPFRTCSAIPAIRRRDHEDLSGSQPYWQGYFCNNKKNLDGGVLYICSHTGDFRTDEKNL